MIKDLRLQKPLEDYIALFEKVTSRSIGLFANILNQEFVFEDPYHKSLGYNAFSDLMHGRFGLYEGSIREKSALSYRVHDVSWGKRASMAYMYWSMVFPERKLLADKGRNGKVLASFDGMSEICISQSGEVLSQRDFWGKHENFNVKGYKALKLS